MLYGNYKFRCRLESNAVLPYYKGSTFRGVFGRALKKVVCALKQQECDQCLLRRQCVYALVFETAKAIPASPTPRMAAPPHPFVIEPPITGNTHFPAGSAFEFNLLLFGEVNHSLPYFIYAFEQMGKIGIGRRINGRRGKFVLESVNKGDQAIYTDMEQKLTPPDPPHRLALSQPDQIGTETHTFTLSLMTPLRLKFKNRLKADLPFHVLVRAMLRRVSSLLEYYDGGEPQLDYRGLVKRAEDVKIISSDLRWFDWRRYSFRQDQSMLMGGMVGSVTYENVSDEFLSLLRFCEEVHLGKQTAFGLGSFRLEVQR